MYVAHMERSFICDTRQTLNKFKKKIKFDDIHIILLISILLANFRNCMYSALNVGTDRLRVTIVEIVAIFPISIVRKRDFSVTVTNSNMWTT